MSRRDKREPAKTVTADSAKVVEPIAKKPMPLLARHRAILFGVGGPYVVVQEGKWNHG